MTNPSKRKVNNKANVLEDVVRVMPKAKFKDKGKDKGKPKVVVVLNRASSMADNNVVDVSAMTKILTSRILLPSLNSPQDKSTPALHLHSSPLSPLSPFIPSIFIHLLYLIISSLSLNSYDMHSKGRVFFFT